MDEQTRNRPIVRKNKPIVAKGERVRGWVK